MPGFEAQEERTIETPWGAPSDAYVVGKLAGKEVAFLARHGRGHRISPSELNFRANIYGMKSLGVERILSLSAVGSLKEEHKPLDFVIPDQFVDRTRGRVSTFFGEGLVAHISFAHPICPQLARRRASPPVSEAGVHAKLGGTYLCMEGPAFSTLAESNLYRSWGMDVIGMTNLQEAKLAREAEICYVTIAMVTDYDCWHPEHDAVTVNDIIANLTQNAANAAKVVAAAVARDAGDARVQMRIGAGARSDHRPQGDSRGDAQEAGAAGWKVPVAQLLGSTVCGDEPWPSELLDRAIAEDDGRALLSIVVERLGDLFEPRLCEMYARLFRQVIERVVPRADSAYAPGRQQPHVRAPDGQARLRALAGHAGRRCRRDQRHARRGQAPLSRRPRSFSSGRENRTKCLRPIRASPPRPLLMRVAARCAIGLQASAALWFDDGIVIDPDSRLTQLGLISRLRSKDRYFFFESRVIRRRWRMIGCPMLARAGLRTIFGVEGPALHRAAALPAEPPADITVSLGVGENPAKRLDDDFERELAAACWPRPAHRSWSTKAAAPRSASASNAQSLPGMRTHDGAFAPFAAQIAGRNCSSVTIPPAGTSLRPAECR